MHILNCYVEIDIDGMDALSICSYCGSDTETFGTNSRRHAYPFDLFRMLNSAAMNAIAQAVFMAMLLPETDARRT
jgi:hypothetical protein